MVSEPQKQMVTPSPSQNPSTTSHHTFSIKLTNKNYLAWKTQFLPLLNYQNLTGFVDGSKPPPPKTIAHPNKPAEIVPNSNYLTLFQQDQMLLCWLFSSLFEEVFPYVIGMTSSYEVWSALANTFGSISHNRQFQLNIELQELKKNDMSVSQYLQRAKSLADELASAGRTITTAKFNVIVYSNIGSEYHNIITALNLRLEPVSFNELHSHLLAHEILLNNSTEPLVANFTHHTSQPPNQYSANTNSPISCPSSNPTSSTYRPPRRNCGPCQICNLKNHTADRCRRCYEPNCNTYGAQANLVQTPHQRPPLRPHDQLGTWLVDSGTNYHVTPDLVALNIAHDYSGNDHIRLGNGQGLEISHIGTGLLPHSPTSFLLNNILHVPSISQNSLSVHKFFLDNNCFFEFWPHVYYVKDQVTRATLLKGQNRNGLYIMPSSMEKEANVVERLSFDDWHTKLGHPHSKIVSKIIKENHLESTTTSPSSKCTACCMGKLTKTSLPPVSHHSKFPLELIFSDVWGLSPTLSNLGFKYFVIFVDDFTRFTWIIP